MQDIWIWLNKVWYFRAGYMTGSCIDVNGGLLWRLVFLRTIKRHDIFITQQWSPHSMLAPWGTLTSLGGVVRLAWNKGNISILTSLWEVQRPVANDPSLKKTNKNTFNRWLVVRGVLYEVLVRLWGCDHDISTRLYLPPQSQCFRLLEPLTWLTGPGAQEASAGGEIVRIDRLWWCDVVTQSEALEIVELLCSHWWSHARKIQQKARKALRSVFMA